MSGRTIELAGRRFPVVALVCPQDPDGEERSEWDRSLGTGTDGDRYIPAENGLLFIVRPMHSGRAGYELNICAATCELSRFEDHASWIPRSLGLLDGRLVTLDDHRILVASTFYWQEADPDWIVETIDRLSRLPLPPMEGPRVRMVDFDSELER